MRFVVAGALLVVLLALARWVAGPPAPPEMLTIEEAAWARERARQALPPEQNGVDELIAVSALSPVKKLLDSSFRGSPASPQDVDAFLALEPRIDALLARSVLAPPDVLGQPNPSTPAGQACVVLGSVYQALVARPELAPRAVRQLIRLSRLESGLGTLQSVILPARNLEVALEPLQKQVGSGSMSRPELLELQRFLAAHRPDPARLVEGADDYMVVAGTRLRQPGYGTGRAPRLGGYRVPDRVMLLYWDRRQRLTEVGYVRMRPSFLRLESHPIPAGDSHLELLEKCKLRYRLVLDRYAVLELSVALQLDPNAPVPAHPRISYDRDRRTIHLDRSQAWEPGPAEFSLKTPQRQ